MIRPRTLSAAVLAVALTVLLPGSAPLVRAPDGRPTATAATSATDTSDPTDPTDTADPTGATLPALTGEGKAPAAALLAREAGRTRFAATGSAIGPADHFRAGSVTKTFLATVILQLAAERRLSLSDTVDTHLPGLVRGNGHDGRRLSLRHLLSHTSGLPDYTRGTARRLPVRAGNAVRIALDRPPLRPGRFAYSNTNYVLLGMVVEQVTRRSYAAEATRRILRPLGLRGTSFPGGRTRLPAPRSASYTADGRRVAALDPRTAGAAGELVTTLADLDRFFAALLGGELLSPRALRAMLDTRAAEGRYGLGLMPSRLPCGRTVWGHNGRIAGSYVRSAAGADGGRALTFRLNSDAPVDPAAELALLTAQFCPRRA